MEGLQSAGAGRHNGRNATSQRLTDDQAVRLHSGCQYQQVGGIPFPVERLSSQHSWRRNPLVQSGRRDFGAYPDGVVRSGFVRSDQIGRPCQICDECKGSYQCQLILGRRKSSQSKKVRTSGRLAPPR
jgi:hypothetical protein